MKEENCSHHKEASFLQGRFQERRSRTLAILATIFKQYYTISWKFKFA